MTSIPKEGKCTIANMPSSLPSICCYSRWCRSPDNDKEDTWMEPCRSSTKSKRRSTENNEEVVHDCNDNAGVDADAAQPLLVEDDVSDSILLTEPIDELCHSGSSFEAAIKAADASSSVIIDENPVASDTTTPMNNCSISTATQKDGATKSSKWRYPFSSGRREVIDTMDILGKETVNGLKGAKLPSTSVVLDGDKSNITNSQQEDSSSSQISSREPITSIVILDNGLFVTASKSHKYIKLWKIKEQEVVSPSTPPPPPQGKDDNSSEANQDDACDNNIINDERNEIIEFICEFKGHDVSGVTTMVKLDTRGRFLTASLDKTVKLWEIDCTGDDDDELKDGPNVLATFENLDERWIKCIVPLDEGSFVRPTDGTNFSMVKAMTQSIMQCSGAFATSSKNGKTIKVWEMSVLDHKTSDDDDSTTENNNACKVCLDQELQHNSVIEAVEASEDRCSIIVGDVMGDVFLWNKAKSYLSTLGVTKSKKRWTLIHKFTWRDDTRQVHTGEIISSQHSITSLCYLDGSKFVSGTKEGMVQIWDSTNKKEDKPQMVRVAEQPVSGIQKISMDESNVEGFSVCCDGGRVVALTVKFEGDDVIELDAFPLNCVKGDDESSQITTMKAIAWPCKDSRSATSIVGDDNGAVYLSLTELV